MRRIPPKVELYAKAYHTEQRQSGHDQGPNTVTVTDHVEKAEFKYASWRDDSGRIAGLDKYDVASVQVEAGFECGDEATRKNFTAQMGRMVEICKQYRQSVMSGTEVTIVHPKLSLKDPVKIFTRSPGAKASWWMSLGIYDRCRFVFPVAGTLYRCAFLSRVKHVRYKIMKTVFANRTTAPGCYQV
eukprot:TRINITY_DN14016_c0_g1_i1.p1 TRINITY_DN14016_c0_g1~~TRINITY_DN14016_c0_g1_i1.p1  ORF type:complete len:186 (+),score=8.80 TRINITY_DN14016_c0_g1_i1:561-1118(+)